MNRRNSVLISLIFAGLLWTAQTAHADDMGAMDMGGMTHEKMPEDGENAASMDRMMSSEHMEHDPMMAAHMGYTDLRPKNDADQKRADELVETLQKALAKYKDFHVAEADGYKPWHPEVKQPVVHFTRMWYGLKARSLSIRRSRPRCCIRGLRTEATSWSARCTPLPSAHRTTNSTSACH